MKEINVQRLIQCVITLQSRSHHLYALNAILTPEAGASVTPRRLGISGTLPTHSSW